MIRLIALLILLALATGPSTTVATDLLTTLHAATDSVSPVIQSLIDADDPATCDRIGWNATSRGDIAERSDHFRACAAWGLSYTARCARIEAQMGIALRRSPESVLIMCQAHVSNEITTDRVISSPLFWQLVTADGKRHSINTLARLAPFPIGILTIPMLPSAFTPPQETAEGWVLFQVPADASTPLRIEIFKDLSKLDETPVVIILDTFVLT